MTADHTTVYAGAAQWRATAAGARDCGLFRMAGGSGAWEALGRGLPEDVEVRYIAVRPDDRDVVYAGTHLGPYRSADGGATWESLNIPGPETVVWSILLHPTDPDVLYVGTQNRTILRTADGGRSWRKLEVGRPEGLVEMTFPLRVVRLALDAADPDTVYAAFEVGGVVRSRDGGETWASCNAGLLALAREERLKSRILSDTDTEGMMDSHALAVSPVDGGRLWLANRMGLFTSADRGESWEEFGIGRFSPLTYARDVQVSRHDPATMYAALSVAAVSDEGSLYRSRDGGESWSRFDRGVAMRSTLMIIAQSPESPDRVWCATRRGQVLGTTDGGATWREHRLPEGVEGVYALACT